MIEPRRARWAPGGPGPADVDLVATDLDGTLLDDRSAVTGRAAAAVRAARAAGIHVVPVTGRPPQALWDIVDAAGLGPIGVCSNGAVLVDCARHTVLETEMIAGIIARRLVEVVRAEVPGVVFATDNLDRFTYETGFFAADPDWTEAVSEVADITPAVADGCVKLIARRPGSSAVELIADLEAHVAEEAYVTTSGSDWVDLGAPGISKAYALERVCDRLGVAVDRVVAVGDNHNDLSVLGWAGTAMAPANAIPEVLAAVDHVLPANTDGGVPALLEELVAARTGAG